jgi:hypothetical protein
MPDNYDLLEANASLVHRVIEFDAPLGKCHFELSFLRSN